MIDYLAHAQIVFNTSDAVLRAASAALDDEAHIQSTRRFVSQEREFLYGGLANQNIDYIPRTRTLSCSRTCHVRRR